MFIVSNLETQLVSSKMYFNYIQFYVITIKTDGKIVYSFFNFIILSFGWIIYVYTVWENSVGQVAKKKIKSF